MHADDGTPLLFSVACLSAEAFIGTCNWYPGTQYLSTTVSGAMEGIIKLVAEMEALDEEIVW